MCLSLNKIVGCFWNRKKATEGWEKAISLGSDGRIQEMAVRLKGIIRQLGYYPPHKLTAILPLEFGGCCMHSFSTELSWWFSNRKLWRGSKGSGEGAKRMVVGMKGQVMH